MSILEISNLRKEFAGLVAVDDLSFEINDGEIVAIIGPNGAGKTTIFNLLSGVLDATSGEVRYNGQIISGLKPHQITPLGMVRTFQNVRLFQNMTALENVMTGHHIRVKPKMLTAAMRLPGFLQQERTTTEYAMDLLDFVGLGEKASLMADQLPYGQQRLLEIARALATQPDLLLLDEPAAGLNLTETEELSRLILKIRRQGVTIILVEHDMGLVMGIADRIIVLDGGQKIAEGPPQEIRDDQRVIAAYLGE
jgi:branched-chain amino acid transport system ATP-binding protein